MKKVTVFGSTGSIGKSALEIIDTCRRDFSVQGLCAYGNDRLLFHQVRKYRPRYVCLVDEKKAAAFKKTLPPRTRFFSGLQGLDEFASIAADIAVMGISGLACLRPLIEAMKHSPRIALANKEALVCAAPLVKKQARRYNTELLPVDSEINALFQLFQVVPLKAVKKICLTASGGALFDYNNKERRRATVRDVLAHPTWRMGKRITVDSATMVNKGFEVVEAHEFFELAYDRIDVIIHRQSMVHALIQAVDGISFCCVYAPDMKVPISHALYYPRRTADPAGKPLFRQAGTNYDFLPVNQKKFPLLRVVLKAAQRRDNSLVVFNASDETAIESFLKGRITFSALSDIIMHMMDHYKSAPMAGLKDILYWDSWARRTTKEYIEWKY